MKISLLISTYERPDALAAVLRSVERQTKKPHQIVVGDDGSGESTKRVIEAARGRGLPVEHAWLPHDGFRLARMRNCAAARATGDYLVIMDDDILLHPEFLADHEAAAREGFFAQGGRALLGEEASRRVLAGETDWPGFFSSGVGNRKNILRSPFLSRLFAGEVKGKRGIRTCNFALWREDYFRVNGFNEDFVGWGREDSEFVTRLFLSGVRRRNIKFAALGCHLHHPPRSREGIAVNDNLLSATEDAGAVRCERGVNVHLDRKTASQ